MTTYARSIESSVWLLPFTYPIWPSFTWQSLHYGIKIWQFLYRIGSYSIETPRNIPFNYIALSLSSLLQYSNPFFFTLFYYSIAITLFF